MKKNIKKLSVLVGVPVIALFIMVVMASAGPAIPYGIHGEYAVTGFTSCSPTGQGIMEVDYTFSNDGTGSATGWVRNIPPNPQVTHMYITLEFTYTVTKEGRIEFGYPWGGFKVYAPDKTTELMQWDTAMTHGVISPDGKTITISCGPPAVVMVLGPDGKPVPGTETYCITTLAGMRMK